MISHHYKDNDFTSLLLYTLVCIIMKYTLMCIITKIMISRNFTARNKLLKWDRSDLGGGSAGGGGIEGFLLYQILVLHEAE